MSLEPKVKIDGKRVIWSFSTTKIGRVDWELPEDVASKFRHTNAYTRQTISESYITLLAGFFSTLAGILEQGEPEEREMFVRLAKLLRSFAEAKANQIFGELRD